MSNVKERREIKTALNGYQKKSDEESKNKYCNCRREYVNILENKKQRWQAVKSEQIHYMSKHRYTRNISTILRKHFKKSVNTKHLDPDRCLRHFAILFTNNNNELLLKEVHILGPVYTDKLDDVFTTYKVKSFISRMKITKHQDVMAYQQRYGRDPLSKTKEYEF